MENTQSDKKDEDYDIVEKIFMVIFWQIEIKYCPELKEKGYITKYRSRRLCITIGVLIYVVIIALCFLFNRE